MEKKSDFILVNHETSSLANKIIITKRVCKLDLKKYRKEVRHYHLDNSIYALEKYKEEINCKKQAFIFHRVDSYH